jgi:hypothetical protein
MSVLEASTGPSLAFHCRRVLLILHLQFRPELDSHDGIARKVVKGGLVSLYLVYCFISVVACQRVVVLIRVLQAAQW